MAEIIWIGELAESPLGAIWIARSEQGLVAVDLWGDKERLTGRLSRLSPGEINYDPDRTAEAAKQIKEYLHQHRREFSIPLDWSIMTPFQQDSLRLVARIPYGQTQTYGEIAQELGNPKAIRAVGRANATNPIPLIIPCHRVLGADGRLQGFSAPGGVETKAWLLRLEGSRLI